MQWQWGGGGIILYVREDIPSKEITCYPNRGDIESIFVEINLYKKKWLIGGTYNPCKTMISNHVNVLSKSMNHFAPLYDNFSDFNADPLDNEMKEFCDIYDLKNLVKEPT